MILAFSGVDGSGKSTQIDLLRQAVGAAGRQVVVFWFRPGYSPVLTALRDEVRRLNPNTLPTVDDGEKRDRIFRRRSVRWTWIAMALADTLIHLGLYIRWLSSTGKVVLCDRYLFDSLLDLELRFPEFQKVAGLARTILGRILPSPDVSILLSLDPKTMEERLAAKEEPFPDPPELRLKRHERYQTWAETGLVQVVDASRSIHEVHRQVVELVARATGLEIEPVPTENP